MATQAFINNGGAEVDRASGEVRLSQIFRWYAPDFGARPLGMGDKSPLLRFIARHLTYEEDREYLLQGTPRVRFQPYDWSLNQAAM